MTEQEILEALCKERNEWQSLACRVVSVMRQIKAELTYESLHVETEYDFAIAIGKAIEKIDAVDPGEMVSVGFSSGERNV